MIKKMITDTSSRNNKKVGSNNEDINLIQILNFCLRNKFIIGCFSLITFLFSLIYAFSIKKVWEGQFQIVINSAEKNSNTFMNLYPSLQGITGLTTGRGNSLNTEVGILQSPSVLMPVFDLVSKDKKTKDNNSSLIFSDWLQDNLGIELIKRTSILNISYRDTDREIILPVLEKMTSSYQDYSTRSKKLSQKLEKNFLEKQIKLYRENSSKSLKEAQEFAIDQDLLFNNSNQIQTERNYVDSMTTNNNSYSIKGSNLSNFNLERNSFEEIRIQAANEIKRIDLQLDAIEEIGDDSEKLQYIGFSIPSLVDEGLPLALSKIERKIAENRSKYTNFDITSRELIEQRDLLIEELKKSIAGYLDAQRTIAEAKMISAKRPKEVLLKYKDLTRKSLRDESTLVALEDKLAVLKLEESRKEQPWKLITKPTLLLDPVAPNKKQIVLFLTFLGFLGGTVIAYFREFKKEVIFDKKKLEMELDSSIIEEIKIDDIDVKSEKILFLRDFLKLKSINYLCLLNLDQYKNSYVDNFIKTLKFVIPKIKIKEIKSVTEFNDDLSSDTIFLITQLGNLKFEKVNELKKRLNFFKKDISGILLIKEN